MAFISWAKVVLLGLAKWPAKLAAVFVVPFLNDTQRVIHPVFGVQDATDLSYYNIAIRNGAHNMITRPMPNWVTTATNTPDDPSMERYSGLQWRRRESDDGRYVSFRVTFGPVRFKGKREIYVGWTMNEESYMRITFIQVRIF